MYSVVGTLSSYSTMEKEENTGCGFLCRPWWCYSRPVDVALVIDLLDLKAIEINSKSGKQTDHKFPSADDSNLKLSVTNILNYLRSKILGDVKWVVFSGDLSQSQQIELNSTVSEMGFESVYFIDKFEGLQIYLLTQLYMSFTPFENVAVILDRDTYVVGHLWKQVNGQLIRCREERVDGTGIENMLTVDDLKKLRELLLGDRFCENFVIEAGGNRLVLEKFFDYKLHETFLMVGLGYRSVAMVPYARDNYIRGAILKAKTCTGDKSSPPVYISKEFVDDKALPDTTSVTPQCTIL
ncbi:hypothetical protein FO519_008382 [Halicephalobus sp. NKZ332]|nr:hypothetical protein FO519_008382 [Halicephalobus sp. NKZ332]